MEVRRLTKIARGQDGAVWGKYLFRFQMDGSCHVYDLDEMKPTAPGGYQPALCCMDLHKTDRLVPHCNGVFFGTQFYAPDDEFPLLYANIYNNYKDFDDRRAGQCCVYRVQREKDRFTTTLVQLLKVDFTDVSGLWCSEHGADQRPYGNFVIDREAEKLYAFTMIDDLQVTRFFGFSIPRVSQGTWDPDLDIRVHTLTREDIREQFDCEYQRFIQGVCCHKGIIYSLEGLAQFPQEHGLAIISTEQKCRLQTYRFSDCGLHIEPELIDFYNGQCIYADNAGNCYALHFEPAEG
ncbi:MAG: hypothetical protein E7437_03430 [Ruminococcaceae bacterium]|nr:hypothetical protein [Oscillospiraceae bacterium]